MPQMFERAELHSLKNTIVYSDLDIPKRVLAAWSAGVQEQLIATATVIDDYLLVIDCNLKSWEIPFDSLSALAAIPVEKRTEFEIDEDGSYLYCESADIHLDLESLRAAGDSELQTKLMAERILYEQQFGVAIASVRKAHNLRKTDIPGLSERQVRGIEKGERPHLLTLRKLAKAHGMSLNEYLEAVAQQFSKLPHSS
ncbi:MAG: hypothetical protein DSM107014_14075 [Gomphosphaeria aponina SAG 52.96 = DSM 107014]|uniref:HTH cro/C1-type domain-containing protein n=1 Tax=Gomphosphaeria aponina SAG 52.96 = DSM 107014 TaxID=1521640 RepID=A0A941JQG8_9CHRO|nr:hypothetical protein [Gomphosphaeria aponina SAG 52.96 = DSM 107014]